MTKHLRHSRITKAFTDTGEFDFDEAEARLSAVHIVIAISETQLSSPAAQACALTALATAKRTFENVTLHTASDVQLLRPIPRAQTLKEAARLLGASVSNVIPETTTHQILIGPCLDPNIGFNVRCWWDKWLSGVRPSWDDSATGADWNPIAGVFAGALAVREIFAEIRGLRTLCAASNTISLWEPWESAVSAANGPEIIHLTRAMTIVGLGHVGQGLLWSLCQLPAHGGMIVLQDYQHVGVENAATGLLTSAADVGRRKTRVAADWCEFYGWQTELIERKFNEGYLALSTDPAMLISALDSPIPRKYLLDAGFEHMLDIGVGHGPVDFEIGQLRIFSRGDHGNWGNPAPGKDNTALLDHRAYQALKDQCGAFTLASASVAVPFVGAAMGALALTQILRLGAMQRTPRLFQFELSAPEMPSCGSFVPAPSANMGTVAIDLTKRTFKA
jgi:hypothetical protein